MPAPGETLTKDPSARVFYVMNWDRWLDDGVEIATHEWIIDLLEGTNETPLTQDNAAIVTGGRKGRVRLLAGTLGSLYRVTHRQTTNENPDQRDDRSFFLRIRQR